ncbi:YraN family protein [Brotaphodocola sp.]|uniref:YraN family protein n=1 Tax=Brotaphodocola sp. TaxID=3073577 RepID=UPI003D7F09BE
MNRREMGARYEYLAEEWLRVQGLEILARNFRSRSGEIDLIARDGQTIVFVEVKYRSSSSSGDPEEAVGWQKQNRIRNTARYYLYRNRYGEETRCRFDVVAILGSEIRWIRNAF